MIATEVREARERLESAWKGNRIDDMEAAARALVDHGDWEMLHRLVQELVGLAEGNLCQPTCKTCNAEGSGLYSGNASVGRLAANFARILTRAAQPVPCPECSGRRCQRCYGMGRIAGPCPSPLLLYLRGLRAWWPRGWWGWLRHVRHSDPLALLTFAEAHKRLAGLELLDTLGLTDASLQPESLGYLTPPVRPTSASVLQEVPGRAVQIRLLGPSCPELPEVPPCFCHDEGDCPICQGNSAQSIEEHHAAYSRRTLCSVCEGGTFCVRCDPRSLLHVAQHSQEGYLQPWWSGPRGRERQRLERQARPARGLGHPRRPRVSREAIQLIQSMSQQLETLSHSMSHLGEALNPAQEPSS